MPYTFSHEHDPPEDPDRVVAGKPFLWEPGWNRHTGEVERTLDPATLRADHGPAWGWLEEAGVTAVRAWYDGGNDEGFGGLHSVLTPAGRLSAGELIGRWAADGTLAGRAAAWRDRPDARGREAWRAERGDPPEPDAAVVGGLLESLACDIVCGLLGGGWGDGPGELFGEVELDLAAGTLTEDPAAAVPDHPDAVAGVPGEPGDDAPPPAGTDPPTDAGLAALLDRATAESTARRRPRPWWWRLFGG